MQTAIGDITIHRVIEQTASIRPMAMFPDLTPEILEANRSWLEPHYLNPKTGKLVLSIQSYLVRMPGRTILIDTCVGNHKPRAERDWNAMASPAYEAALAALGVGVEDIDLVMCTHLHIDHVGWNTRLDNGRWVPTFPKAAYLFAQRELDYWTSQTTPPPWIVDSVQPVLDAGRATIVRSDHAVTETLRLLPTPGHTIDHFSVALGRPGAQAIVTGDMIHSPLQFRHPELSTFVDYDKGQSAATRRRLFGRCCDDGTLICGSHFATPAYGRLQREAEGFRFVCA